MKICRVIRKYVDTGNGGRKTDNMKNDCIPVENTMGRYFLRHLEDAVFL
jgi:hypothetical protein